MKKRLKIGVTLTLFIFLSNVSIVFGQVPTQINCGETIESVFTSNEQLHRYTTNVDSGTKIIFYAEAHALSYETLEIEAGLWAPNGFEINELSGYSNQRGRWDTIWTDFISNSGQYSYSIRGWTSTGASYTVSLSCVREDGTVTSATPLDQGLTCGSILENNIYLDLQTHRYYIYMNQGDTVRFVATTLTTQYEVLALESGMWAPNGFEIDSLSGYSNQRSTNEIIETQPLSVSGVHYYTLQGWTSTGGDYQIAVTCTLADGTVINPGDAPLEPVVLDTSDETEPVLPEFSGFGFPGLAPVDFAGVAQLPIPPGIPMSGAITPNGNEIIGYQFDANANDTVDLSFTRLSGNLNLGLVVIDDNSNVIYQASLVTTESMTAHFTVPATGQYTAAIYRISLFPPSAPEATAFQVSATVNP